MGYHSVNNLFILYNKVALIRMRHTPKFWGRVFPTMKWNSRPIELRGF